MKGGEDERGRSRAGERKWIERKRSVCVHVCACLCACLCMSWGVVAGCRGSGAYL